MNHLCDANVFIAIAVEQHFNHGPASDWFSALDEPDTAAFCRATQNSFLRLLTQRIAVNFSPLTNAQAWMVYEKTCEDSAVVFVEEPKGIQSIWRKLATRETASPKVWMDAYLAAFAIAGGMRLVSLDQDFKNYQAAGLDLWLIKP